MKKARWLFFFVGLCILLWIRPASGCRYNVRETGFVDLGIEPYVLCGYIDANTPAEVAAGFKVVADAALAQSNIIFRLIDTDRQKEHPGMKYLDPNSQSAPCAVLVSPDGQTLAVSVTRPGESFETTFRSAVEKIVSSPKRDEILRAVSKAYGVVLLLEGPDGDQNKEAVKAASAAIELVASQLEFMPKEIAHPPELVVMDSNCLEAEEILLWSIGLEPNDVNEPLAIVMYGMARWIGPLFRGEQVNEDDLASVLFVIGADCECGFDYRWLLGTMLPAKWTREVHERAVESLGFDPESPMIKMEIGSIIGRGMGGYGYQGTGYGYRELIIEPEADLDELQVEPAQEATDSPSVESPNDVALAQEPNDPAPVQDPNLDPHEPNLAMTAPQNQAPKEAPGAAGGDDIYSSLRIAAFLTIGLFALVIILGIAILARSRRV